MHVVLQIFSSAFIHFHPFSSFHHFGTNLYTCLGHFLDTLFETIFGALFGTLFRDNLLGYLFVTSVSYLISLKHLLFENIAHQKSVGMAPPRPDFQLEALLGFLNFSNINLVFLVLVFFFKHQSGFLGVILVKLTSLFRSAAFV